jgi:hypothetical protein
MTVAFDRPCTLWPECGCAKTLAHFQEALPSSVEYTWPQLQSVAFTIAMNLACVVAHCPDPVMRAYAARQLSDPFWSFALYENRDLEDEDFDRRAAR